MIIPGADRLKDVSEYYFSRKLEQIRQMNLHGEHVINLGIGSPDLPPSSATIDAAVQALHNPHGHGYATHRGTPELRLAITRFYDEVYGVDLNADSEVLPLLGSKEGILYLSLAFLNPNDEVLVPNPGYAAYAAITKMVGAKVRYFDLDESKAWWPNLEELEKSDLNRVKMMWVNYPNMPTGARASRSLFEQLIAFGKRHSILICHDNPYSLVLNTEKPLSLLDFDLDRSTAIELNSFSKSFNMAGWRVGMLLGPKQAIDMTLQMKSNVDSGMFLTIQSASTRALANPLSWHRERNETYAARRAQVFEIFEALEFSIDPNQVGLFVWAKAPDRISSVEGRLDEILSDHKVFLTPGFIFGSRGERYARASLCADTQALSEALARVSRRRK